MGWRQWRVGKDTVNLITWSEGALRKTTGCYMLDRAIKSAHENEISLPLSFLEVINIRPTKRVSSWLCNFLYQKNLGEAQLKCWRGTVKMLERHSLNAGMSFSRASCSTQLILYFVSYPCRFSSAYCIVRHSIYSIFSLDFILKIFLFGILNTYE